MSAPALLLRAAPSSGPGAGRRRLAAALAAGALLLGACGGDDGGDSSAQSSGGSSSEDLGDVTVGAFNFGESQVMANMYALLLEDAGYSSAEVRSLGNREVVMPALQQGDITVVPEYLGTATEFLNKAQNGEDAEVVASGDVQATLEALQPLASQAGLEALEPSAAQDQNAFAVTQEFADANSLSTLTDLGTSGQSVVLGGPPECPDRPFCQPGLEETYGIDVTDFRSLDAGGPLTKQAVAGGEVDLGLVFSSDGSLESQGLVVLEDDQSLQTADNLVPLVNAEAVNETLTSALTQLSGDALTTEQLQRLNTQVDVDGEDPREVAEAFLTDEGLLGG